MELCLSCFGNELKLNDFKCYKGIKKSEKLIDHFKECDLKSFPSKIIDRISDYFVLPKITGIKLE